MGVSNGRLAMLSAGGTGGHLFPAEALAHELISRGWRIQLMTDDRAEKYADSFPCEKMHIVKSATPSGKNPIAIVKAVLSLARGTGQSRKIIKTEQPSVVIGFGGYPTIPPLWASTSVIPTAIHEQNAVMGRANKLLAMKVDRIAGGFLKPEGQFADKIVQTGNPVRPAVLKQCGGAYSTSTGDEPFNLVVFGGSQGASYFSEALPPALEKLSHAMRRRLRITQQARPEDEMDARKAYAELGVEADVSPFFADLPKRIADAHLVIARSGASTVSEIAAIGRPSVLVPYPHALDHDQAANAASLEAEGGTMVRKQSDLDTDVLSALLMELIDAPERLKDMAEKAAKVGKPKAASLLADLTETIAD
ncbi:MAG: undecaprenyldiphospho-muramoylpentapeptide beta-N-acetylglucosaminyltransferase [Pseudomonadota bacterium]